MPIDRPTTPKDHPHRLHDCQQALRTEIRRVMDEAFATGWSDQEITTAVMELANDWYLSLIEEARAAAGLHHAQGVKTN